MIDMVDPAERAGLEDAVRRLVTAWPWTRDEPALTAEQVMARFGLLYVDARAAGLSPREAIEVLRTGVDEYRQAVATVLLSCPIERG